MRRRLEPFIVVALLLALWATRLTALGALPLHNDEGLHLARAVEVWNLHPFWEIRDGKVINHWLIAALYPQHAPVYAGRLPTIFVALVGLAAGYALTRRLFGLHAAIFAGMVWIASPYLFFYERTALSDAEAGALLVVTLWACLRLSRSGALRDARLTGLALAAAALFKLTAAPFALMVALVVLLPGRIPARRRLVNLGIVAAVVAACFAVPLLYLLARGETFSIALGWLVGSQNGPLSVGSWVTNFGANLARLVDLITFHFLERSFLLVAGLIAFPFAALLLPPRPDAPRSIGLRLLLALLLPLGVMMALGREMMPRHYMAAFPLAAILAGAAVGILVKRAEGTQAWTSLVGVSIGYLALGFVPFAHAAYTAPGQLTLPPPMAYQYLTSHSAGFGLREAVEAFPRTIVPEDAPIVLSMFPDSCRRAAFYNTQRFNVICTAAPGEDAVAAALAAHERVYVLAESPPIGLDVQRLSADATLIASYPRPGEDDASASVRLWRLERRP